MGAWQRTTPAKPQVSLPQGTSSRYKKGRHKGGLSKYSAEYRNLLSDAQVNSGLTAIAAGLDFVVHLVVLVEAVYARTLNCRDVHEMIFAAVIGRDEAKALGGVEELDGAIDGSHFDNP